MSIKVLIAEDNEDYRQMLGYYLTLLGFEIIFAGNGREAVERADEHVPHIILMDLNMPVMDGWEATRIINQNQKTAHIPIIVVSANSQIGGEKALEAGAVGYVQKPVDITLLPDMILNYADQR